MLFYQIESSKYVGNPHIRLSFESALSMASIIVSLPVEILQAAIPAEPTFPLRFTLGDIWAEITKAEYELVVSTPAPRPQHMDGAPAWPLPINL